MWYLSGVMNDAADNKSTDFLGGTVTLNLSVVKRQNTNKSCHTHDSETPLKFLEVYDPLDPAQFSIWTLLGKSRY